MRCVAVAVSERENLSTILFRANVLCCVCAANECELNDAVDWLLAVRAQCKLHGMKWVLFNGRDSLHAYHSSFYVVPIHCYFVVVVAATVWCINRTHQQAKHENYYLL